MREKIIKYSILEIPPFCPKPEPSSYIRNLKAERPFILESSVSDPDGSVCEFQLPPLFPPDCSYMLEAADGSNQGGLFPQEVVAVGNIIKIRNILPYPTSFDSLKVTQVANDNEATNVDTKSLEDIAPGIDSSIDNTKDIFVNQKLSKKQKEKLRAIHQHNRNIFNSDLRTGYNGKAGDFDVDFEWVHNKRPPVNSGKCVNYHRKKADKDLMQAMIDRLEEQKKVAKATDLGMIPRYASPAMLVLKNKARNLKPGEYDSLPISKKLKYNRFVQCLQKLNQYVEKKPFDNVDLEDTIYKVGSAKYVITGDLTDSFQQRWISKSKQPYFCFNSPYKGTYFLLSKLVAQGWCVVFHDNLYVIGDDIDTTVERWRQVLETLNENN